MGKLSFVIVVFAISTQALAQIEFSSLIENSITRQNELASDIALENQLAQNVENSSDDFDSPMIDNYKKLESRGPSNVASNSSAAAVSDQSGNVPAPAPSEQKVLEQKEFSVKLKPTGADKALQYFPNLRDRKKAKKLAANQGSEHRGETANSQIKKNKKVHSEKPAAKVTKKSKKKFSNVAQGENKPIKKKKSKNRTTASNI